MKKALVMMIIVTIFGMAQVLLAQAKTQGQVKKTTSGRVDEKGGKIQEPGKPDESKAIAFDVRLVGGLAVPMGALSTLGLEVGGGGHLDAELKLPFMLGPMQMKVALSVGFYGMGLKPDLTTNTFNASISLVPILGYAIIAFPIKSISLTPYIGIGGGGNASGASITGGSKPSLSSFDGTLAFRLGAGYALPPLPRLSILLNLDYLIIFEQDLSGKPNNAQMLDIELGVSYRLIGK